MVQLACLLSKSKGIPYEIELYLNFFTNLNCKPVCLAYTTYRTPTYICTGSQNFRGVIIFSCGNYFETIKRSLLRVICQKYKDIVTLFIVK